MAGLDAPFGVDRDATLAVYSSAKTGANRGGILRSVLTGSLQLQARLHAADLVDTDVCPFCQLEPETLEHCFWKCPCWEHIRQQQGVPSRRVIDAWPACTRQCGFFVEKEEVFRASEELEQEGQHATTRVDQWSSSGVQVPSDAPEIVSDGRVVVFTDGACRNNGNARLRRAGCGIYYAPNHANNFSCHVPGRSQSNQRAGCTI